MLVGLAGLARVSTRKVSLALHRWERKGTALTSADRPFIAPIVRSGRADRRARLSCFRRRTAFRTGRNWSAVDDHTYEDAGADAELTYGERRSGPVFVVHDHVNVIRPVVRMPDQPGATRHARLIAPGRRRLMPRRPVGK
jgi:hypothetical protein